MLQCPLLTAATSLVRYAPTALAPYGVTAVGSLIPARLQAVSNRCAMPSSDLGTEVDGGLGWSQMLLMATGVVVAGTALRSAFAWLWQSGASGAAPSSPIAAHRTPAMQPGRPRPADRGSRSLDEAFAAGTVAGYRDALEERAGDPSAAGALEDLAGIALRPAALEANAAQMLRHWQSGYRQGQASAQAWADR